MTITAALQSWKRRAGSAWSEYEAEIPEALDAVRRGRAHDAILLLGDGLATTAALVTPAAVARVAPTIAPVIDQAVAELDRERPRDAALTIAVLKIMNLGNAVECTGGTLARASHASFVSWLPRVNAKRDAPEALWFWNVAFASIAMGDAALYRRFTGVEHGRALPFVARTVVGFNLQALAAHLAGAIESGASVDDVMPAFDEFIDNFESHDNAKSANKHVLLWIARIVFHRIGGAPLAEVATRLLTKLEQMAVL